MSPVLPLPLPTLFFYQFVCNARIFFNTVADLLWDSKCQRSSALTDVNGANETDLPIVILLSSYAVLSSFSLQ